MSTHTSTIEKNKSILSKCKAVIAQSMQGKAQLFIAEESTQPSKLGVAGLSPVFRSHFKALTIVGAFFISGHFHGFYPLM